MKSRQRISHVVGFDDGAFEKYRRADVPVIGAVYSDLTLQGVLAGRVRVDGANATRVLARLVGESKYAAQIQLVLLQGVSLAGFNVVDLPGLAAALGIPVMCVARRRPDLDAVRAALLGRVAGGARKWRLIEKLGPMEPAAGVWIQRAGIGPAEAERLLRRLAINGKIPEPLRAAHLIAGGITLGQSRGRT